MASIKAHSKRNKPKNIFNFPSLRNFLDFLLPCSPYGLPKVGSKTELVTVEGKKLIKVCLRPSMKFVSYEIIDIIQIVLVLQQPIFT